MRECESGATPRSSNNRGEQKEKRRKKKHTYRASQLFLKVPQTRTTLRLGRHREARPRKCGSDGERDLEEEEPWVVVGRETRVPRRSARSGPLWPREDAVDHYVVLQLTVYNVCRIINVQFSPWQIQRLLNVMFSICTEVSGSFVHVMISQTSPSPRTNGRDFSIRWPGPPRSHRPAPLSRWTPLHRHRLG